MKLPRTKAQEVVNTLFGRGKYVVKEEDIQGLIDHFHSTLLPLAGEEYADVLAKFLEGDPLNGVEVQRKFHLMRILQPLMESHPEVEPTFLVEVDYASDKHWSLADMAEAIFGAQGDSKIYHLDLATPDNKEYYTTLEVKSILDKYN